MKYVEAQPKFETAMAIREDALGMDHPDTISSRVSMADLYTKQGFLDKAAPLLEKIASAHERGRDELDLASALNDGAELLRARVRVE